MAEHPVYLLKTAWLRVKSNLLGIVPSKDWGALGSTFEGSVRVRLEIWLHFSGLKAKALIGSNSPAIIFKLPKVSTASAIILFSIIKGYAAIA